MTVEGENDDISGVGQTEAAHRAVPRTFRPSDKVHYMQPAVGHYGVFNGSRFRSEIAPRIADFVLSHNGAGVAWRAVPAMIVNGCRRVSVDRARRVAQAVIVADSSLPIDSGIDDVCYRCAPCFIAGPASRRRSRVDFDREVYLVRVRRHRAGAPLHAAHSFRHAAKSCSPCRRAAASKQARDFAQKHGAWIAARLEPLCRSRRPLSHGTMLPLRGARSPHRASARRARHGVGRDQREWRAPALRCRRSAACAAPRTRFSQARGQARSGSGEPAVPRETLGVAVKRVSIRDQSSRWGSCSTTGVLSYSWRLILAPPFVLDYLAAHEVAHLVEMNHSRAILAAGRAHLPAFQRAPRPGSTRMAAICIATACRYAALATIAGAIVTCHGRACPGHLRLWTQCFTRRGCPAQGRA